MASRWLMSPKFMFMSSRFTPTDPSASICRMQRSGLPITSRSHASSSEGSCSTGSEDTTPPRTLSLPKCRWCHVRCVLVTWGSASRAAASVSAT